MAAPMAFPVLPASDIAQVAATILHLFDPSTSAQPSLAKSLQQQLQDVQSRTEAWGLISGLAKHEDANVRFFSAHTAQVKISRDWDSLPTEMQPALLALILDTLAEAVSPTNATTHQPGNAIVVRKLFGCLASLILRLPFYRFPDPITTVLQTLSSALARATALPPSAPVSGYSTPVPGTGSASDGMRQRMRLWALEWCGICVEEISRAGLSEQKRTALRRHIDTDLPAVMATITESMTGEALQSPADRIRAAEAACKCADSWINYGIGADEMSALLPHIFALLPLPAASGTIAEVLSESIFKFGKGSKILTEPLLAWVIGPNGQGLLGSAEGEPSDAVIEFTKMLCALVEHSSDWLVARLQQPDVQAFFATILRITGWDGVGGVDENVSELTLPIYPLIQEAIMESDVFAEPHETSASWAVAKQFFRELVLVTRRKVRWPGSGEEASLGGLDREDRDAFDTWRRDAGEVIVGAYYILREDMLSSLTETVCEQVATQAPWQDVEATLHCIRYSGEGVPLGEETSLPLIFSKQLIDGLSNRPHAGLGEERLRLTFVCLIRAYEEWFKYHPDHLWPVLSYLVPSLTSSRLVSPSAADSLKALCDICRSKLVQHIGAFSELHGKIGDLGPEEQTKVIEGITSVIQALAPADAIGPVQGIMGPIVDRMTQAVATREPASLVQAMNALTACFKGLSPSDDEIFDVDYDDQAKQTAIATARSDPAMVALRQRAEQAFTAVVQVWNGDAEVADAISSLLKQATISASETLISLSPLPLLTLVCAACEQAPSALWMSLASTLTLRIGTATSELQLKTNKTSAEDQRKLEEDSERWQVVGDAANRLAVVAGRMLGPDGAIRDNPDVVESWFKFCHALASRFPGVLLRLPEPVIDAYMSLGIMGLAAQERFSLKGAAEFFVALFANTRYPSPLEEPSERLVKLYGPRLLRALLLSAGAEGPRSVIPNLAQLLASLVTRSQGSDMAAWLDAILAEPGFPDPRATPEAKARLKGVVLRTRLASKLREALHEFALVARGLANTTYGNATAQSLA
ncbi:ARM repeat-containing protein [Cutaneotrichosporon oleaginosum]|uniref:ARM repeat-containing protein n=1 Tax=Cutaneotrichosporon oleaginosum TaxID=879819 RepID=A0A0J0XKL9_9TREE|nr:ARM repeat-containing protein [Cutaneotrichosporon oleaginosum]KLT41640.1 ARM repeat-containing protein [Cutaneotrichosporon oleaginosum]TXT08123.1 hypothetical protein COLE_05047 [Cutaneotrichosporon oleaginosum]